MASPGFLSKRVKKKSQTGLTTDRYEFLGLDQAEPDLGDPLVGFSSIGANPVPVTGTQYVLTAYQNQIGKRYWTAAANIVGSGLVPGSFTVFDNDIQVGAANSFNRFNFVGNGVSVDPVGAGLSVQTGVATIRIAVTELVAPGNLNTIPYHSSSGFLAGAEDFVYVSGNVGIGSTQPTVTLDIIGNEKVSGIITASSFVGNLTGNVTGNLTGTATTANTANSVSSIVEINTSGIITSTGGFVGNLTGTATTANNVSSTININTSGIITSTGGFVGNLTGTATTANNVSSTIDINTSGIITATTFYGNLIGNISTTGRSFETLQITGFSTFINGPVVIGTLTPTGTASQRLQVTGGAYVSGNLGIGTTNPTTPLQIETYGIKTGVGTFTAFVGVSTTIDSFSVSSTDFKTAEYTIHIGFGSYIQAQKVLVMQNQTTAYAEEYSIMYNNSLIVSIGATISGGNCILQATPQTGISGLTTYRFARNTLL